MQRAFYHFWIVGLILATAITPCAWSQAASQYDIPSQPLADSLRAVGRRASTNVLFDPPLVEGRQAPALKALLTADEAFSRLLDGSGLKHRFLDEKTVTVVAAIESQAAQRSTRANAEETQRPLVLGQAPSPTTSRSDTSARSRQSPESRVELEEIEVAAIPEVLVVGSKILNMDIKRSADDAQPYVIFDRATIQNSGAKSLEEFFKTRLPMNSAAVTNGQLPSFAGNISQINLRGLGSNQTLILIDGHRAVTPMLEGGNPQQSDINGIPLDAIERIEVLPSTASGIYGGNATGGVINIIRRRDYSGVGMKVSYDNTFESDAAVRRVDMSAGFALEDGKTNLMLTGSYADANLLTVQERDLVQRGRAAILANNPSFFLNPVGNPIVGATPNIRSANGQSLTLRSTGQSLDSPFAYIPQGYTGVASDGGAALVANAGRYNLDLPNSATLSGGRHLALSNTPKIEALSATLRREFGARIQAFLDLGASDSISRFPYSPGSALFGQTYTVAATAPNNPFAQDIRVTIPTAATSESYSAHDERRGVAGVIVQLPGKWMAEADYTWHRSRFSYSQPLGLSGQEAALVRNGSIDVLRDLDLFPPDFAVFDLGKAVRTEPAQSTLKDATLRMSGTIGSLPGGAPTLTGLIEHRDEVFDGGALEYGGGSATATAIFGGPYVFPDRSQSVDSAYLELKLPLVSAANRKPGVEAFEAQLAGRWDDYEINGVTGTINLGSPAPVTKATAKLSSTNPTFGLRYQPFRAVALRASYGTGFVPPTVSQLARIDNPSGTNTVFDPKRGGAPTTILLSALGGNPDLRPEESESWSAGAVFTPTFVRGLRLSVDYTRIDKTDNITQLSVQQIVDNEDFLPAGRVTRDANGVITHVDGTQLNLARAKVEAYDLQLDYSLETATMGTLDFFVVATRQTHFQTQITPTQPFVENIGYVANAATVHPLKLKGNVGLAWQYDAWTLGWTARYFDSYLASNPSVTGSATTLTTQGHGGRVPTQTYHDLFGSYRFAPGAAGSGLGGLLDNTEIRLGITNVLNERPPFDVRAGAGRYYSPFGDPRLASYSLTLSKSF